MKYNIPYSQEIISVDIPEGQVDFIGDISETTELSHWKDVLLKQLDKPTFGPALDKFITEKQRILILVEDNTRHTPVKDILPVLCQYLAGRGCTYDQIEILIAPGTHRQMTFGELLEKLGQWVFDHNIKISQHDSMNEQELVQLDNVYAGDVKIPVFVNKRVTDADLIIGIGNIIPHPNAGYSGGAKILDPGCCGASTISATHTAAALMGYLPLGIAENACRNSMEKVAASVGLDFIINVVLNHKNEVIDVVTGDFIKAHRAGAEKAKKAYGVPIKEPVDILIACSAPYDIDYWQCEKALIAGYFAVKPGGIIIFPAPCIEGLAHNHDDLLHWLALDSKEISRQIQNILSGKAEGDLVAAGIALGASMVREKADIYIYSTGLTDNEISKMRYTRFQNIQAAIDTALGVRPNARIGILPRGGDCLPYVSAD